MWELPQALVSVSLEDYTKPFPSGSRIGKVASEEPAVILKQEGKRRKTSPEEFDVMRRRRRTTKRICVPTVRKLRLSPLNKLPSYFRQGVK